MNEPASPPGAHTPRLDALLAAGTITEEQHRAGRSKIGHGILSEHWLCDLHEQRTEAEAEGRAWSPDDQHEINLRHRAIYAERWRRSLKPRRLPPQRRAFVSETTRPREHRSTATGTRAGPSTDASPSSGDPEGLKLGPGTLATGSPVRPFEEHAP